MEKYSLYNMLNAYHENQHVIECYMKNQSLENFDSKEGVAAGATVMGLGVGTFLVILFITMAIWFWALVALINNWHCLPGWAQVVSVISLLFPNFGGPILTLIIVYAARTCVGKGLKIFKKKKKSKSK